MGVLSFRLLGFQVVVEPWFWLVMLVLGADGPPQLLPHWILAAFLSVLAHELGHAFMGRAYGLDSWIRLYGLGGLTTYQGGWMSMTLLRQALMSLAGPMAGFAFALLAYLLQRAIPFESTFFRVIITYLIFVNIAWSILNLLPVVPLDGGNIMRQAVYWWRSSNDDTVPLRISLVVASLIAVVALVQNSWWTAGLFGFMAFENYQALQRRPPWRVYNPRS
jgi:stage IV sporulation protein FB